MPPCVKRKEIRGIYPPERSPLAQRMTQRDLAQLLGVTIGDLHREIWYKEPAIVRRPIETGRGKKAKVRNAAYPQHGTSLHLMHQRLARLLWRIELPSYVYSPQQGRTIRDNAALHAGQPVRRQLDLKAFYPSTTTEMIRDRLAAAFGMYRDVANLIAQLVTIDGKAAFGSTVTPILIIILYRDMFDRIAEVCEARGLRFSVWVDDITISGRHVGPELLEEVREIVREYGHRTHKITFSGRKERACTTGIWNEGLVLMPSHEQERRLRYALVAVRTAGTNDKLERASMMALSAAGTIRQIAGASSDQGRRMADLMETIRRLRRSAIDQVSIEPSMSSAPRIDEGADIPF